MTSPFFKQHCYIDGQWLAAASNASIAVHNPASGAVIGSVPSCEQAEVNAAITSSARAFADWKTISSQQRGQFLREIASKLRQHLPEIGRILSLEQGKPLKESEKEIIYACQYLEWFAEEACRAYGETMPTTSDGQHILVFQEPLGVCAGITPWNFPIAMIARKLGPALAAGCSFIAKPAEETPFSALALAAACEQAGLPPGVFNVLTGRPEIIGSALMNSATVKKVSFTGSTEVGKILIEQSAATIKKLTLELGGNAPFLIFQDADLDRAVAAAVYAKYRNAGQSCIAVNRFIVHEKVAADFTERFAAASRRLHVGNGLDPDTDIGPLISAKAWQRLRALVADAIQQGGELVLGGLPEECEGEPPNLFVYPTIIQKVTPSMRIVQEEIFGPVSTIQTFVTETDAMTLANDTHFGLASYVFTQDISRAFRVIENLKFGMVGLNDAVLSLVQAPFGGIKQSGYGREGGWQGLAEYLSTKLVVIGK